MNEQQIRQATTRREQQEAALLRPDGSKFYGDAEHKERERAIERDFSAQMDKIEASVEDLIQRAREQLLAEEHGDPATTLTTGELQRAEALRAFISEDAENLSNAALIERARAAVASKDKPRMYVLQHVAAQRLNQNPDGDLGGELMDAARVLRANLDPEAETRLEAAKQAVQDAEDLHFKAQMARVGANNLGDAFFGGGQGPSSYWGAAS